MIYSAESLAVFVSVNNLKMQKPTLIVSAGILCQQDRIFCARRGPNRHLAGKWEFPGGKLEPDEPASVSLARELREELNIQAKIGELFAINRHEYETNIVELHAFWVRQFTGQIRLTDHDAMQWLLISELPRFQWAPADIPFIEKLTQPAF